MSNQVHVLTLGYATVLHEQSNKAANDGVRRREAFAKHVGSYTHVTLTLARDGYMERQYRNIHAIPTDGRNLPHALWRMYRIGRRLCAEGKVNVIQTQEANTTGLIGYLLKRHFGLPLSICVFGPNPWDEHWVGSSPYDRLTTPLARHILRRCDRIIADGSLTLERLREVGIPEERLVWKVNVPSNINDFAKADGRELRRSLLEDRFEHLLLFVGSMSVQKNIPFVLRAFKCISDRMPTSRLMMIGKGRRRQDYMVYAEQLGLLDRVHWIEAVPHADIPTFFRASDLVLLGSHYEGFPRVFVEAAAAGRPVVTTQVSGCGDGVIDGVTGYVVAQGDIEGFANSVLELLNDPGKAAEMGKKGQQLIRELDGKRDAFNQLQVEVWDSIRSETNTKAKPYA
jgi:glycosyltransferase involved in cell wall biosynthesis